MGNSSGEDDPLCIDWYDLQSEMAIQKSLTLSPEALVPLGEFLDPENREYSSPLASIFAFNCRDLRGLEGADTWLTRDGAVPLIWFFRRFPEPGPFRGRLLVHRSLSDLCPAAWRPQIGTYRFSALREVSLGNPSRLNLAGLVILGHNSAAAFARDGLRDFLKSQLARAAAHGIREQPEVLVYLPFRGLPGQKEDPGAAEVIVELVRVFGNQIRFLSLSELEWRFDWRGYALVELNDRMLCADRFLTHYLTSRGATLLEVEDDAVLNPDATAVPTSLSHGFVLGGLPPLDEANRARLLATALSSPANSAFPWARWSHGGPTTELRQSPLTGWPEAVTVGLANHVVASDGIGSFVEKVQAEHRHTVILGWSRQLLGDSGCRAIMAFMGSGRVDLSARRIPRLDVADALGLGSEECAKCGFEVLVPLFSAPEAGKRVWLLSLHEPGQAHILGCFEIQPNGGLSSCEPALTWRGTLRENQRTLRIDCAETGGNADYDLLEATDPLSARFVGTLESCGRVEDRLEIAGWMADRAQGRPPEAIAVMGGATLLGLLRPALPREDVARRYHSVRAGFNATLNEASPAGPIRVLALFSDGYAVPVPGSGSAQ